ncbi:hypothetical protein ACIGO6_39195 [Streptomyces sp. NPDC053750]|uniref:hypothetical protein n=1 Tax=Streptomyces sp. NPDC053750 TaxID=3365714 RepID=UPI0037CD1938
MTGRMQQVLLGARIAYLAVHDEDAIAAGFAAVFLLFTAVRVRTAVRALRARRHSSGERRVPRTGRDRRPPLRSSP